MQAVEMVIVMAAAHDDALVVTAEDLVEYLDHVGTDHGHAAELLDNAATQSQIKETVSGDSNI
jgi:hypothetical protein